MKNLRILLVIGLVVWTGWGFNANAQPGTVLYSFTNGVDGALPYAGLVQGSDGNFYGTTVDGGISGYGTVFRISSSGSLTNLHSFSDSDGASPQAELAQGSDGNFYGTTAGAAAQTFGNVFRISPSGSFTNLHTFTGGSDGGNPYAGLVQGRDGNFYGTAASGGANGDGTVFRISPGGSFTNLYSFSGSDGVGPFAGLVQGRDGNFYGTTPTGGNTNFDGYFCCGGGTVFRISPGGSFTNLHTFNASDGVNPTAALVQGSDGDLYGVTESGGNTNLNGGFGYGTVFRINPGGSFTNLHIFGGGSDGGGPDGLVQGSDGNFYGTTSSGEGSGAGSGGTVFRISPTGSLTSLYSFSFSQNSNGISPKAGVVQGSDGNFYGTTGYGGTNNAGTVFKLIVPLSPPANQISTIQQAGTNLVFSIPSVASETYQLQFSPSMNPTNWTNVAGVSVTNSIGALMTLTNFGGATGPQGFYRFAITP